METLLPADNAPVSRPASSFNTLLQKTSTLLHQPMFLERTLIGWARKLRIFYFTCAIVKKPSLARRTFKSLLQLRSDVWGGELKKLYKVDGRYYSNLYTPGFPSKAYDRYVKSELRRYASPCAETEKLTLVFLAITRKCPLRCEHCFEWDNLNQKESFTNDDLLKVIDLYRKEGVQQIHFSGGEPMVRLNDLLQLIAYAGADIDCWVLTSGFNFTESNAKRLKEVGCKGVVVSIDHYIPERHDAFRGRKDAFANAVGAIEAAKKVGLVTAISICVTRAFLDDGHLQPYLDFAKSLGVQFVQVLGPKQVGHYAGKDVLLNERHIQLLEKTFTQVNHDTACRDYPILLYHGYYQRRIGCFSGSRSVYVDSAGEVHACPFCHTKSYNIISLVRANNAALPVKENKCPLFEKTA